MKNIRRMLDENVIDVRDLFLDKDLNESHSEMYVGKVVDNKDPDKIGRCKIRVFGVFGDEIPDRDLPWAIPDFAFIGSKKGSFIVPPEDTIVRIYFDQGDIYLPVYTRKVVDENNLPADKDEDYPDNMIFFETDEGDKLMINRKTGKLTFVHNSGNELTIEKNGNSENTHKSGSVVSMDATGNITIDSKLNVTIKHGALLVAEGSVVIPTGSGPLCALPACLFAGAPQTGTQCAP